MIRAKGLSNLMRKSLLLISLFVFLMQFNSNLSFSSEVIGANQRVVLAELFTATWCGFCPFATNAINKLAEEYGSSLVVLQYHPQFSDPFGNSETDARISFYGATGYPTMIFDGTLWEVGGSDETQDVYRQMIEDELTSPTEVSISLSGSLEEFVVEIAVSNMLPELSAKVRFVVYEKDIPFDAPNGEKISTYTVRRVLNEEPISLGDGKISITRRCQPQSEWDIKKMGVAVFVQRDDTLEVLQAATLLVETLPPSDSPYFSFVCAETTKTINTNEIANFTASIVNSGGAKDIYQLTTVKSLPSGWEAGFCLGTMCYWDSASISLEPGSSQTIDAYIISSSVPGTGNSTFIVSSESYPAQTRHLVFTANVKSPLDSQLSLIIGITLTVIGAGIILTILRSWIIGKRKKLPKKP